MAVDCRQCYLEGERAGWRYALAVPKDTGSTGAGSRLGSRTGHSIDFRDYRDYQPGDDLRWIDWNVYARSDKLTVKLFHEEVSPHLDLLLDVSGSMDLEGSAKGRCALISVAMLAAAAANAGCTFACWLLGEQVLRLGNDRARPGDWDHIVFGGAATAHDAFFLAPPALRRNGMRVLVSDLMWPDDPLPLVRRLGHQASWCRVIQILAREELHAPEHGNTRLVNVETEAELEVFVDTAARKQYTDALDHHRVQWEQACRSIGGRLVSVMAEEIVENTNVALLYEEAGLLENAR